MNGPRDLLSLGLLLNDRGRPLVKTPLLEDALTWYESGATNAVLCTPRRQGKSSCAALLAVAELLLKRDAFVLWVSGSGDQAADVLTQKVRTPLQRMRRKSLEGLGLNLGFSRQRVTNRRTGAAIEVLTPVEVSAPGRTVSLLILDESRAIPEEVVEVLRPSAAGGRILAVGSPGPPRGWWHRAVTEPGPEDFVRHYKEADLNPEVPRSFVEAERERLAKRGAWGGLMARREWSAEFVTISEHPLLDPADVGRAAVACVPAFDPNQDGCVIGADLSVSRDLTSLAVVARRLRGPMRVLELVVLDPRASEGGRVSLPAVEAKLHALARRYRAAVVLDQFQGQQMATQLRAGGVAVEAVHVTSALNMELFDGLQEFLQRGLLTWERGAEGVERLESELVNLEVSETLSGFRVVDRDRRYHRDVSFALGLACRRLASWGPFEDPAGGPLPPPKPTRRPWVPPERRHWSERVDDLRGLPVVAHRGRLDGVRFVDQKLGPLFEP